MRLRFGATLTTHLFKRVVILTAFISLSSAAILLWVVQGELNAYADDRLANAAKTLALLTREGGDPDRPGRPCTDVERGECFLSHKDFVAFQASADWRRFALFRGNALVIGPRSPAAARALPQASGFRDFMLDGEKWRAFGLPAQHGTLLVVMAEPAARRRAMVLDSAHRFVLPILLLIVCSAIVLWFTLQSGLSTLQRLSGALMRRSAQDLTPLEAEAWPLELHQPIASLNRLFQRVREAFSHEQKLADQAAHQLRTPLAALKVQAQLILRDTPEAGRAAVQELLLSVDSMSNTVNHMLALARLDATELSKVPVDLVEIVRDLITDRAPLAARHGIEFSLSGDRSRIVTTDPLPVRVALSALIDNAISHGASGGLVDVEVSAGAGRAAIRVKDRGPGLSLRMCGLLERGEGRAEGLGGGLGLPIVRRAMEVLQGEFRLRPAPEATGLIAEIFIPA